MAPSSIMSQPQTPSFYWFDYETFGTHPAWDRPCQFAGVRTDMDLNVIDDAMTIYCQQSMDYLPHPAACKITGLTPQDVNRMGVREAEFIARIIEQIGKPGTCSLGYNTIRFDDEFTRHTLFRNFFEPYEYEYKDGNSRWDLLDVVRLTRALRPEGIQWPVSDDGKPSNRLELLSAANGIEHGNAHDALSDVRATIGIARLIRKAQPKLFDFAFNNRTKHAVAKLLDTINPVVCLQVSGMISSDRAHIAPILPLAMHPENRNSVIVLDLGPDPTPLLTLNAEDIAQLVFTKREPLDTRTLDGTTDIDAHQETVKQGQKQSMYRPGLRTVQINKCPVIVPKQTLRSLDAERLGVNEQQIHRHEQIARQLLQPNMRQKIISAMTRAWPDSSSDVDGTLYSGAFLSPADRQRAAAVRKAEPADIEKVAAHFDDKRLIELATRYQGRNFPDALDEQHVSHWKEFCLERLTDESSAWLTFAGFDKEMADMEWSAEEQSLKNNLINYRDAVSKYANNLTESCTPENGNI